MDRRVFLRRMAGGATALSCTTGLALSARGADPAVPWGYRGAGGPERWGMLDPSYTACSDGARQSPVDIQPESGFASQLDFPVVRYRPSPLRVHMTPQGPRFLVDPGSTLRLGANTLELYQYQFHTPSEHTVSRRHFEMEAHFIHRPLGGPEEALGPGPFTVIGVFLREQAPGLGTPGDASPERAEELSRTAGAMRELFSHVRAGVTEEPVTVPGVTFDPARLLPTSRRSARYFGSLTTPPCTEGVQWMLLADPVGVPTAVVDRFRRLISGRNARPKQPFGRRYLLFSD